MEKELTVISLCCRKEAVEDFKDNPADHHDPTPIYTCSQCKFECDVEDVCADCLGTGEISTDEEDGEGHTMRGVGSEKCHCQNKDDNDHEDD